MSTAESAGRGRRGHSVVPIAERGTDCVFCGARVALSVAMKTKGLCEGCRKRHEEDTGLRTLFDRESGVGEIPAGLRERYGLGQGHASEKDG